MNTDPKYADYYALLARQEDVTAMGGCNCCAVVKGRTPKPRRYWWIGPNGNGKGLCESCHRIWQAEADADGGLRPGWVVLCEAP